MVIQIRRTNHGLFDILPPCSDKCIFGRPWTKQMMVCSTNEQINKFVHLFDKCWKVCPTNALPFVYHFVEQIVQQIVQQTVICSTNWRFCYLIDKWDNLFDKLSIKYFIPLIKSLSVIWSPAHQPALFLIQWGMWAFSCASVGRIDGGMNNMLTKKIPKNT